MNSFEQKPEELEDLAVRQESVLNRVDLKELTSAEGVQELALVLVTAYPDGLLLADRQDRVVYANPSACRLLTRPFEELMDTSLNEALEELMLRAHDAQGLYHLLDKHNLENPTLETDVTLTVASDNKNNTQDRSLHLILFAVLDTENNYLGRGLGLHDTSRERIADQLKNEFVAVVSHELRTPLSAMQGFSELLLTQDAPPERQRLWLEMINRESVRLSGLIEDMLSLSRIESGRLDLRPERVEIETIIRQCVEILRVGTSKHSFKIEIEEGLPAVRTDKDKLIQILNNIISNAIKYSPKGGQITIRALFSLQYSDYVEISVSDQGMGIAKSEVSRVFEKFYRVQGNNNKEIKGTGLGLAITRNLVELQGGKIWVESTVGKGSVFHFTVPIHTFPQREVKAFKDILYRTLLVSGKDTTEAELYLDYLQRTLPPNQLDEVLRDTLYEIGERWHSGEIGVGEEHLATGIIRDFLARTKSVVSPPNGLRLVIGSVSGEEHIVGVTMVAKAFMRAGWAVVNLGANVPVSAFITTITQAQPDTLLLSISLSQRLVEIKRVVQEVREAFPNLIIGIGGRLLMDLPDLASRLGADFHATTPEDSVRVARQLVISGKSKAVPQEQIIEDAEFKDIPPD
jgi:signal transduction histidine kinase/methanogenic corrinoid protein MtbC1